MSKHSGARAFSTFALLLCLTGTVANAEPASTTPDERWQQTRALYDAGKVNEAYANLRQQSENTAAYFYNLGTMAFKLDRFGESVAYLEKARSLSPHDADTQYNLRLARASLARGLGTDKLDPASSWLESIAEHISLDEVRAALGLLTFFLLLLWTKAYSKTRNLRRTVTEPAGVISLAGLLICAGMYVAQRVAESHPPAVALDRETVRSGPGDRFTELSRLEPGIKVRLLGTRATDSSATGELWVQIRYSPEAIGWVRNKVILEL